MPRPHRHHHHHPSIPMGGKYMYKSRLIYPTKILHYIRYEMPVPLFNIESVSRNNGHRLGENKEKKENQEEDVHQQQKHT